MSFLKSATFKEFYFGASGQINLETKEQHTSQLILTQSTAISEGSPQVKSKNHCLKHTNINKILRFHLVMFWNYLMLPKI